MRSLGKIYISPLLTIVFDVAFWLVNSPYMKLLTVVVGLVVGVYSIINLNESIKLSKAQRRNIERKG